MSANRDHITTQQIHTMGDGRKDRSSSHDALTNTTTSKNKNYLKESKTKRKAELRRKNLGLGIGTIDVNATATKSKQKIRFDDDFVAEQEEKVEAEHSEEKEAINNIVDGIEDEEEDDDDEVEQVSASFAKNEALQLRAAERETRKVESAITQKRKRKKKVIEADDDELDEDFLALVDSTREDNAKVKKLEQKSKPRLSLGRHTTFVSEENETTTKKPIHADHNIKVVVLPTEIKNDDQQTNIVAQEKSALALSSDLSTEPSKTAMLFFRGSHLLQRNSKKGDDQTSFKRSRKMKYKVSIGRPASNFLVKKKRG